MLSLPSSSSYGRLSPDPTGGIRSRRVSTTNLKEQTAFDEDVTRPTLKRLTRTVSSNGGGSGSVNGSGFGFSGGMGGQSDRKGKGKARESLDEDAEPDSNVPEGEREVLVHELKKTDTLASISIQYGITPQAIRSSNRLWASDSIHLRKVLHIPVDQCRLHTSRVSDNLVLLDREPDQLSHTLMSPTALRNAPTVDLLDFSDSARSSLDLTSHEEQLPSPAANGTNFWADMKGKARAPSPPIPPPTPPPLDAVSHYLRGTNNPYSSRPSSPHPASPFASPPQSRPVSEDPFNLFQNAAGGGSPLAAGRKVLPISRVPASKLSFFPPPNPAFSAPSASSRSSFDDLPTAAAAARKHSLMGITSSLARMAVTKPSPSSANGGTSWLKRWDPTFFGGEEDELNASREHVEFQQAASWGKNAGKRASARRKNSASYGF